MLRTERKRLKARRFLPSTRPSLQAPRPPPGSAGKCLTAQANHALTRSSLQARVRAAAGRRAAVAGRGCARGTRDACGDTRASNRDGARPRRAGPGPGSPGRRDPRVGASSATAVDARAGSPTMSSSTGRGFAHADGRPGHKQRSACSAWTDPPGRRTIHTGSAINLAGDQRAAARFCLLLKRAAG